MGENSGDLYPGDRIMMAVQQAYSLFCDAWKLYRSFAGQKLCEKEKENFINQAGVIGKKYAWSPLAKELISTIYHEIDRRIKEDEQK